MWNSFVQLMFIQRQLSKFYKLKSHENLCIRQNCISKKKVGFIGLLISEKFTPLN